LLVGIHYAVQVLRPRFGYGADVGGRSTPWIVGGVVVLAIGGLLAAVATAWLAHTRVPGVLLAGLGFLFIGVGVGASGTSLLVLLSRRVRAERRAAAASTTWLMMIMGFAITAGVAGHFLDPYSPERLIAVMGTTALIAVALTVLATAGLEGPAAVVEPAHREPAVPFREALEEVWQEQEARRFTIFVFVSMLAFSAQDLILEPFAGAVFGYTPGESTQLAGLQHAGVLVGMLLVGGLARGGRSRERNGLLLGWIVGGCIASALVLFALAIAGTVGPAWPLDLTVFALGIAVGGFSVAAIGSMMGLVRAGRERREGTRMGLWGAAQGIAFGLGALVGTAAIDWTRQVFDAQAIAYSVVFAAEGVLFLVSAWLAVWVEQAGGSKHALSGSPGGDLALDKV
ncbi:MAG: BCD family MFS transporter, partial [Pseudomonadota bacterium]